MTRTIVVANQKGGVGKTTTVANLGSALAMLGQRVLLVDLDPQAALTATFGLDPYTLSGTMATVLLKDNAPLSRILRSVGNNGRMALAPGSLSMAAAEVQMASTEHRTHRLRMALARNRVPFDLVLIDTPPSLGLSTLNGLVAADEVLIPVQCQYLAMRGVRALMETVWRVRRKLNPDLNLLGLLPTMYDPRSRHSYEVVGELRYVFKEKVLPIIITSNMKFAEVPVARQTLVDKFPDNEGAIAYRKLAEVIVNG